MILPDQLAALAFVVAAVSGDEAERTGSWVPWLAGFAPGIIVIVVAWFVLRWLRRR